MSVRNKQTVVEETVVDYSKSPSCLDYVTTPVIVNSSNATDMKYALDDAFKKVLIQDLKFTEIHTHTDTRLLIGFAAVAFSAYASVYSYVVPFPECKLILLGCVIAYFTLNSILMLYATFVEKNVVFQGVRKDPLGIEYDERISLRVTHEPFAANYTAVFESVAAPSRVAKANVPTISSVKRKGGLNAKAGKQSGVVTLTKSFGDYFDVEGRLAPEVVARHVAASVSGCGMKLE
ncbi:hypothetical protein HKX48_007485 [Thoreauomyces humboldtii]|nr:hypothetical protein HKX48_007485 [Thoreauomyces humboldtii]